MRHPKVLIQRSGFTMQGTNGYSIWNESRAFFISRCIGKQVFGANSRLASLGGAGLILSLPDSDDQRWHQDGMPLFPELSHMLPPYAVNVFVPLTDNDGCIYAGPTEFIPGSHVMEEDVVLQQVDCSDGKQRSIQSGASCNDNGDGEPGIVSPILHQGDSLLYDYRVCHRGASNLAGQTRRVLYLMYARPWFKEHLNFVNDCLK